MIIKNDKGEDVEVFTADEVSAKTKEIEDKKNEEINGVTKKITEEYESKMNPLNDALKKMQDEKTELENKINKGGQGGGQVDNFKVLKDALDKKTEEINSMKGTMDEIKNGQANDKKNAIIDKFAKNDTEMKKKINLFLEKELKSMPESTDEERILKVQTALKLASDNRSPDIINAAIGGAGGPGIDNGGGNNTPEFTAAEKNLGSKMGISEEDYKKYGSKISKVMKK